MCNAILMFTLFMMDGQMINQIHVTTKDKAEKMVAESKTPNFKQFLRNKNILEVRHLKLIETEPFECGQ